MNITPSNILYTGLLMSFWTAPRAGLGVLDPVETTTDRRSRQYFFNIKDQMYFRRGGLIEVGYAANRTFGREIPQGEGLLTYTPDGRRGFNFQDARRKAGRNQFLVNSFPPSFTLAGGHQLKTGLDIDTLDYWQDVHRTGYKFLRADTTVSRRAVYRRRRPVRLSNTEACLVRAGFLEAAAGLLLETGIRPTGTASFGNTSWSPRFGVAWAPRGMRTIKMSAA